MVLSFLSPSLYFFAWEQNPDVILGISEGFVGKIGQFWILSFVGTSLYLFVLELLLRIGVLSSDFFVLLVGDQGNFFVGKARERAGYKLSVMESLVLLEIF